jgi:hypothetical protein
MLPKKLNNIPLIHKKITPFLPTYFPTKRDKIKLINGENKTNKYIIL